MMTIMTIDNDKDVDDELVPKSPLFKKCYYISIIWFSLLESCITTFELRTVDYQCVTDIKVDYYKDSFLPTFNFNGHGG